jgi:LPPG:FO 2-phospho-L-lactate transferase
MGDHILALCGGVGGAKLAAGLANSLAPGQLDVVVNTGDDFEHLGLSISPDIDTVIYTLSGLADPERGWGVVNETWRAMEMVRRLGGAEWFQLGDRDLATHILRSTRLSKNETLSDITADFARRLGITAAILPMSNDTVRTEIVTAGEVLPFQYYFVAKRCEPIARQIRFAGAKEAAPAPAFAAALTRADLAAFVICPSNPYLSIDPILAIPGVRDAISALDAPRVVVSPIVGGKAIKGPTAKLMVELGAESSALGIANHYRGLIDGIVIDHADAALVPKLEAVGLMVSVLDTVMHDNEDRAKVARATLDLAKKIAARTR